MARNNINKMLIDASHPEETRVVVLKQGRVEEFDFESAARKLLRGSIFLAKITRVEPSLQAAFVDYGGNRHGFLAFNEIHPDYYQIPYADRLALLEQEAAEAHDEGDFEPAGPSDARHNDDEPDDSAEQDSIDVVALLPPEDDEAPPRTVVRAAAVDAPPEEIRHEGDAVDDGAPADEALNGDAAPLEDAPHAVGLVEEEGVEQIETVDEGEAAEPEQIDNAVAEDALEEVPTRVRRRARSYKIQEVIKRRQVVLVQVVKEERGTKGAALTTYLSLAGRYTVLMPNTARGGGISRKITNAQDRKRLKAIAHELEVPEGMGLIIRTAGAARTKQEIKRDFEYLLRLWESVRELTLESTAPCLVYEEGDVIKRSIRDLYSKDIDEIVVAGEAAYNEAHEFMRMLMPSHAKNVIHYTETEPMFSRFGIEAQLGALFSPQVQLPSGGYIVINQTEALVAVDVNSGKATREFSIEETALNTNMEAADEIARQLKLRDLAGLIVIDFIDMEEKRNNRAVERRLKEALRFDRARIQLGRISHFGLMEMSRQRLRTGVLEGSTTQCPHCQGSGIVRSRESVALAVLRAIEDTLQRGSPSSVTASTAPPVALYILNQKRNFITDIERRYGVVVSIQASDRLIGANFAIERLSQPGHGASPRRAERSAVNMESGFDADEAEADAVEDAPGAAVEREDADGGEGRRGTRRRKRRRGRREGGESEARQDGGHREHASDEDAFEAAEPVAGHVTVVDEEATADVAGAEDGEGEAGSSRRGSDHHQRDEDGERNGRRGRRRGRRGGRRNRGGERDAPDSDARGSRDASGGQGSGRDAPDEESEGGPASGSFIAAAALAAARAAAVSAASAGNGAPAQDVEPDQEEMPEPVPGERAFALADLPLPVGEAAVPGSSDPAAPPKGEVPPKSDSRAARRAPVASEPVLERVVVGAGNGEAPEGPGEPPKAKRGGWWQRALGGGG